MIDKTPVGQCRKCDQAREIIGAWQAKQGHDRCWYYPDLFRKLATLFGLEPGPVEQVPRAEFEAGCGQFTEEEYGQD